MNRQDAATVPGKTNHVDDGAQAPHTYQALLRHAALGGATPGMADALGMLAFYDYLDQIGFRPLDFLKRVARRIASPAWLSAGDVPSRAAILEVRPAEPATTSSDSVPVHLIPELLREVRRHQWLEAEKAGRNIWAERSPEDPDGLALRDWLARHYGAWRRRTLRRAA